MANKNINWDKVVYVERNALRVNWDFKEPLIIWKCWDELVARFVWLTLNVDDTSRQTSKIYRTGNDAHPAFEFAIWCENNTQKLDGTVAVLIGCLGLSRSELYPQVYVMNPNDKVLQYITKGQIKLKRYTQVTFNLSSEKLTFTLYNQNKGKVNLYDFMSYSKYMEAFDAEGHSYEEILDNLPDLEKNVDPDFYKSMMY